MNRSQKIAEWQETEGTWRNILKRFWDKTWWLVIADVIAIGLLITSHLLIHLIKMEGVLLQSISIIRLIAFLASFYGAFILVMALAVSASFPNRAAFLMEHFSVEKEDEE